MEIENSPARRIPLYINVEFKKNYARQNSKGILKNISLSGAFLGGCMDCQAEDKLNVSFKVSGRLRNIQARVIWANSKGCGIQFIPVNNRDLQIVDDLMYFVESKRESTKTVLDSIFQKVA